MKTIAKKVQAESMLVYTADGAMRTFWEECGCVLCHLRSSDEGLRAALTRRVPDSSGPR
jgi:hypothetical protein